MKAISWIVAVVAKWWPWDSSFARVEGWGFTMVGLDTGVVYPPPKPPSCKGGVSNEHSGCAGSAHGVSTRTTYKTVFLLLCLQIPVSPLNLSTSPCSLTFHKGRPFREFFKSDEFSIPPRFCSLPPPSCPFHSRSALLYKCHPWDGTCTGQLQSTEPETFEQT